jgi:hypothetical protein
LGDSADVESDGGENVASNHHLHYIYPSSNHSHSVSIPDTSSNAQSSMTSTGTSTTAGAVANSPPFYRLAFIMKLSETERLPIDF